MKIYYQDDYAVTLHTRDSDLVPRVGEDVMFVNEDWRVKSVTWLIEDDAVIVALTQTRIRAEKDTSVQETISNLKASLADVIKTQQTQDKKTRHLNEQVATIRHGIEQRIYNESKK